MAGAPGSDPIPDQLEVNLENYNETLRPTYALRDLDGENKWLMLVNVLPNGTNLDDIYAPHDRGWQASSQARFERLLRQTGVATGLLVNGREIRLVYAPEKELSGHITFKLADMVQVAGRPIFAALQMLIGPERLYSVADKERLPAILANSRKYQNVVSTQLAEQVLSKLLLLDGERLSYRTLAVEQIGSVYQAIVFASRRVVRLRSRRRRSTAHRPPSISKSCCEFPATNARKNSRKNSIRVFGRATVTVYDDADFRGTSETFDRSQNELRDVRKRDDSSRVWSDRISSVRVNLAQGDDRANRGDWGRNRDRDSDRADQRDWGWNRDSDRDRDGDQDRRDNRGYGVGPVWGRGPQPRQGACFFRDTNFGGDYFCMARGESFRALPSGFNDRISSVRLFGGTRVSVFQDNDFRGAGARFNRDTGDLHDSQVRDSDRSWNDRISSVQVQ